MFLDSWLAAREDFFWGGDACFCVKMTVPGLKKRALNVSQIQALDRKAIDGCGVPSLALMENAGRAVAAGALRALKTVSRPRVVVVCGLGNNAGDGFVAVRHLLNAGVAVKFFVIGSPGQLKSDAAVYFRVLQNCGYPGTEIRKITARFRKELHRADLIVDALFGVGLNRPVTGLCAEVIALMNESGRKILAVDVPSGMDGTSGAVHGVCVKARQTVTFSAMKKGFLNKAAARLTGRVLVADIGIPKTLWPKI